MIDTDTPEEPKPERKKDAFGWYQPPEEPAKTTYRTGR